MYVTQYNILTVKYLHDIPYCNKWIEPLIVENGLN